MMHLIISTFQGAFAWERRILGGVWVAKSQSLKKENNEKKIREKKGSVLLNINLEKAYNHAKWAFVDSMLMRMGVGEKWRGRTI